MSNPARELLLIFSTWKGSMDGTVAPQITRGWAAGDEPTETYLQAMRHLLAIQRALDVLKSEGRETDYFYEYFTAWLKIVLNYPGSWQTGTRSDAAFPSSLLNQLQGLAVILDFSGHPGMNAESKGHIRATLDEVIELLLGDDSLSSELRFYLTKLVREMQTALDDEEVAANFDFMGAAERLWVAMQAAAGQSTTKKSGWTTVAKNFLIPISVGMMTHTGSIGIDDVHRMLGI